LDLDADVDALALDGRSCGRGRRRSDDAAAATMTAADGFASTTISSMDRSMLPTDACGETP
jgi:hypothetical protein